jgi:hypothetical protein
VQGWIADEAVQRLADLAIVQSISPAWPGEHSTGAVTSQGDHDSRADLVRQLGFDGPPFGKGAARRGGHRRCRPTARLVSPFMAADVAVR